MKFRRMKMGLVLYFAVVWSFLSGSYLILPQKSQIIYDRLSARRVKSDSRSDYNLTYCAPQYFIDGIKEFIPPSYYPIAWRLYEHLRTGYRGELLSSDLRTAFIQLFKYHGIRSILDLGCGRGNFLFMLQPLAKEAGIELVGVDLELSQDVKEKMSRLGIEFYEGDSEDLSELVGRRKFDIIVAAGVLGQAQISLSKENLSQAQKQSTHIALAAVDALSSNPYAVFITASIFSFLFLERSKLEEMGIRIVYWNNEEMRVREETSWDSIDDRIRVWYGERYYGEDCPSIGFYNLWNQSANVAVMQKRR
ncbi:MAG: class I SAM-dependent methyltransferase [Candidatus Omnitrophica bacterium]|nr:class I SAM-dependent methyltransferase [Candidatus Omnitrophota bacterium]